MISITSARHFLYREPTDMRTSFDGVCGLLSGGLEENVMSGDIYILINKTRNRIKLLRWESGGFVLFYKRPERGTFEFPHYNSSGLSHTHGHGELAMLITGISMKNTKKQTRFS